MDKLWTVLLATSPFWSFLLWAAWWLIADKLSERRRARTAANDARARYGRRDEQDGEHGQTQAA